MIPAMLILGYTMGVEGILWAGPFSDALSGIIALITVKVFWKRIFENKGQKETAGWKEFYGQARFLTLCLELLH